MGLRREPKGLAIAGTIIGGLATLMYLAIVAMYGAVLAACIGLGVSVQPMVQTTSTLHDARRKIEDFKGPNGVIPGEAEGNGIIQGMQDYWKHQVRYEPKEGSFVIRSAGADGQFNTDDDLTVDDFGNSFETPDFKLPPLDEAMPVPEEPPGDEGRFFQEPPQDKIPIDEPPPSP